MDIWELFATNFDNGYMNTGVSNDCAQMNVAFASMLLDCQLDLLEMYLN
jgi:hypothetical protein